MESKTPADQLEIVHVKRAASPWEEKEEHGTYYFELRLMDLVRRGNVEHLKRFLEEATQKPLTEGKLADSPLRQAKNIFIGIISVIGKHAAIPGGMDVEEAYELIDLYIQACEQAKSAEEVQDLQYNMLLDFTDRVGRSKLPDGITNEVFACLQYIDTHFTEGISVEQVADYIGRSRAYIQKKFKEDLGESIGAYINHVRMEEAKRLLKFSNRSLSEISVYLHFSSQPYFQNAFKKAFGMTPMEYRKRQGMGL